jgi:hypothetical protein
MLGGFEGVEMGVAEGRSKSSRVRRVWSVLS